MRTCGNGAGRPGTHSLWGVPCQHPKASRQAPTPFLAVYFQPGDSVLVLRFQHIPAPQGRLQAGGSLRTLTPQAPQPSELEASPARKGFAPGSFQDLLSLWECLSFKLSPLGARPGWGSSSFSRHDLSSSWLSSCCSPHAVPSCQSLFLPRSLGSSVGSQRGSQSPLCALQHPSPLQGSTRSVQGGGQSPSPGLPFPHGA